MHFNVPPSWLENQNERIQLGIAQQVHQTISDAHQEASNLGDQLAAGHVDFSSLLSQTNYPTFIYRQGKLVFWSDHTVIPDLDIPPTVTTTTTIRNNYGTFIVLPHQVQDFHIYTYIPLQVDYGIDNNYLSSGLQKNIFGNASVRLVLERPGKLRQVLTPDGQFLFAVDYGGNRLNSGFDDLQLILLALGTVFFVLFSIQLSSLFGRKGKYGRGVVLLLALLSAFRLALLLLNLPFEIAETELFDPRLYAASFWSPSVGDLGLNVLLLLAVAWAVFNLFHKKGVLTKLRSLPPGQSRLLQAGTMSAFFILLAILFRFYYGIYHNSPLALDINQSLDLGRYKLVMFGLMFVHTIALGIFTYMLSSVVTVLLKREETWWPYKVLGLLTGIMLVLAAFLAPQYVSVVLIGAVFWLIIIMAAQHRHAISLPYRTYLFFFLIMAVSAITGAASLYTHFQGELLAYKQKFAFDLMQSNDVLAEYLLEEDVAVRVSEDMLIQSKMKGPYVDAFFIRRKISRQFLSDYFDKYETNILLFDSEGRALESADTTAATLQELRQKYATQQNRTEYEDLYLINDPARPHTRFYLKLIQVPLGPKMHGTIVLQLSLKELLPNSVVPELLSGQRYQQPFRADILSYAIYNKERLTYSEGDFDYATNFSRNHLKRKELFAQGTTENGYHHVGVQTEAGPVVIITTSKYGIREVLSNFSFLFLFFTVGLIVLVLVYILLQHERLREFKPNFSTKIQLFLNFGILLPLMLVSIATAGLVTASYKKDLMSSYEKKGETIQDNLSELATSDLLRDKGRLLRRVTSIAALSEADISLYDRNGRLLVTSQPLIFETGLLSKLVNPNAFAAISERQALRVLLDEQAGNLSFNALYLPLRQYNDPEQLLGFIGIPFFDSERQLDMKLIELITTTMNIFTVMFIMFIILTFFASRALTVPLRMLADKLKHTSLTGKNEMLAYEGTDEIGMLVNEYNRMLLTLEQNKQELAMREKEAAWREMARQVAHEIKNPLTPMKLSLQYLQKAIAEKNPNTEVMINKISHTLITQINILSDIATSFSNFTSMPEPKTELMDLGLALRKAADLHNNPASVAVTVRIPEAPVMVIADEALMVRTFNNLLLNAIQAVPANRMPEINVVLKVEEDDLALISITDNGSGIPVDIQQKVFIPNFSTKYTGSGIGLAVAKKGIENAGGRIWFVTEEGEGTTFYISLPLAKP
ncbi:HAMP domain-containing histidine kinase [Pontibacter sp. JH31]|uniref:histidine kinase n=1 Tax=Pontibacter aquaedesilientis TaxID=2766980 RepID=A0ABR7XJL0_9BACT|nr:HAMP domain-containing sensor histidine kinase [Pontibacter aquaedesilientis]MBD1397813.1 HAMP domain-containing histidine kinase [Pontibacter aquaedesilientis]